jgi:hypothetical protein
MDCCAPLALQLEGLQVLLMELAESLLFMLFHGGFPPGDQGHDTPMWACILHCGAGRPTGDAGNRSSSPERLHSIHQHHSILPRLGYNGF